MLSLPVRTKKPRDFGITSIHDVQLTVHQVEDILSDYADFIDLAKFGVGTALVLKKLKQKIEAYKAGQVEVYFGGTLFEKFYSQDKLEEYLTFLNNHKIDIIEISTGTIDIDLETRIRLIDRLKKDLKVYFEVGSKDEDKVMAPTEWVQEINLSLQAGAEFVITEGRNSGTAGVFRPSGEIRMGLVEEIAQKCLIQKVIFEAPTPKSQMYFINRLGANVNLGNVNPGDLLLLETQRLGLRSETFDVKL
jgi:phosphosulfolactate synthase